MPPQRPHDPGVTRRSALTGLAGLIGVSATVGGSVTGCRVGRHGAAAPVVSDPARAALLRALADEDRLIALYDGTRGVPGEAARHAVIRRDHVAHRDVILAALGGPTAPTTTPPPAPAARPSLREVRTAEAAARSARAADALSAPDSVAPLLASIAASEASHGVLLGSRPGAR